VPELRRGKGPQAAVGVRRPRLVHEAELRIGRGERRVLRRQLRLRPLSDDRSGVPPGRRSRPPAPPRAAARTRLSGSVREHYPLRSRTRSATPDAAQDDDRSGVPPGRRSRPPAPPRAAARTRLSGSVREHYPLRSRTRSATPDAAQDDDPTEVPPGRRSRPNGDEPAAVRIRARTAGTRTSSPRRRSSTTSASDVNRRGAVPVRGRLEREQLRVDAFLPHQLVV
jgi:hypothetical protein